MILAMTLSALLAQATAIPVQPSRQSRPAARRHDPYAGLFKSPTSPFEAVPRSSPAKPFVQHPPPDAKRDDREIVCGLVVVHKSNDFDKGIVIPPNDTKSVIRRVEPQVCRSEKADNPK